MESGKTSRKLLKLYKKAENALTRKKAQKIIKKFDKKVQGGF